MERRSLAVSIGRGFGFREVDMTLMLSRKSIQMLFAFGVVSGVTLPLIAMRPRNPSVPSALWNTPRETTAARLRAAGWEEAACAHTLRLVLTTVHPRFAARFDLAPHQNFVRN